MFQKGQKIITLPSMKKLGIINGMSIGKGVKNMAERFEPNNIDDVRQRNSDFLTAIGASSLSLGFLMTKTIRGQSPIVDISKDMVKEYKQKTKDFENVLENTEAMITTEPVPLIAKLADCFSAVIYSKTGKGKKILALLHLSRDQVDNLLIGKVIEHLTIKFNCNQNEMVIGIFPGMGKPYHTISLKDKDKFIIEKNWKGFMEKSGDGKKIILDSLGNIINQFEKSGIRPENIEAYGYSDEVDTFTLARKGFAFSNRYSTSTSQPEKNGRNLVVVQLPKIV